MTDIATFYVPTSNMPAVLNDKGDLGIVRVSTNQHGVTLVFVPYNELPIVQEEKTGGLGRRATVLADVRLEPGSNDWLIVTTKDVTRAQLKLDIVALKLGNILAKSPAGRSFDNAEPLVATSN